MKNNKSMFVLSFRVPSSAPEALSQFLLLYLIDVVEAKRRLSSCVVYLRCAGEVYNGVFEEMR